MHKVHIIAMDTHSQTTEICVKTRSNGPGRHYHVNTTIPEIAAVIERVSRPRELVLEEGPLAGWLLRNLRDRVEKAMVCGSAAEERVGREAMAEETRTIRLMPRSCVTCTWGAYTREPVHHAESLARGRGGQGDGGVVSRAGGASGNRAQREQGDGADEALGDHGAGEGFSGRREKRAKLLVAGTVRAGRGIGGDTSWRRGM